jgi:uncharacterized membrane protein YfcA
LLYSKIHGVTALLSTIGFAKSSLVDWRKAILLAIITTVSAPAGAVLAHYIPQMIIWVIYFLQWSFLLR